MLTKRCLLVVAVLCMAGGADALALDRERADKADAAIERGLA